MLHVVKKIVIGPFDTLSLINSPVRALDPNNIAQEDFAFLTNPENNLYLPSLRILPPTSHVLFGLLDHTRVTIEMRLDIFREFYIDVDLKGPKHERFIE